MVIGFIVIFRNTHDSSPTHNPHYWNPRAPMPLVDTILRTLLFTIGSVLLNRATYEFLKSLMDFYG